MIVTETGGVLPTAKELGLDSETEDDDSDDDRDKRDDEVASDHDADDITLPRAVTVDRADSAETDQEDRSGKPDGMRACDWRLEQEFPADAFDGSTLYPQPGNDRDGYETGTNLEKHDPSVHHYFMRSAF